MFSDRIYRLALFPALVSGAMAAVVVDSPLPPPVALVVAPPLVQAADSTSFVINPKSREEMRQMFRAVYRASEDVSADWTGNQATGVVGDTSDAFKQAVLTRIRFYRALAGVPADTVFNPIYNRKAQLAAVMMSANNAISHYPPPEWKLYTADAAEAAGKSNLAFLNYGPEGIDALIRDGTAGNEPVGHRRWFLYPQTREMGTGDAEPRGSYYGVNVTWILDANFSGARPVTRDTFVALPSPGYSPYRITYPLWSFSYPGADFSGTTVAVTRRGAAVSTEIKSYRTGYGENTIIWTVGGVDPTTEPNHPEVTEDTPYRVELKNVKINGASRDFGYDVTVFNSDQAGADTVPATVSGPPNLAALSAATFTVTRPSFTSQTQWRRLRLLDDDVAYNADAGLAGATTNAGAYPYLDTRVVADGTTSFRLLHAAPVKSSEAIEFPDLLYVQAADAQLTFNSRLGYASKQEIARVQVSVDDGVSWTDIYTQRGTGDAGEVRYSARTASLSAYVGQTVKFRFNYNFTGLALGGSVFTQTDNGFGWYFDTLVATGVRKVAVEEQSAATAATTFTYTPAAPGDLYLQARALIFDRFPIYWGPVQRFVAGEPSLVPITPQLPTGPLSSGDTRFVNLSIRIDAGAAADALSVGFTVGGTGTKPLLLRAVGPALGTFGVQGFMPDPRLTLLSGSTVLATNDNWAGDAALTATTAAVGAFPLGSVTSKDAALVTTAVAAGYTVKIEAADGRAGNVLAELYDAATTNAARLTNVSVLKAVGPDGLVAGVIVGGTGARGVLIRAVGPALAAFGVGGTLADPRLELYSGQTVIQSNDNWQAASNAALVAGVAGQVGAFALGPNSKDAALLTTLTPGSYTVKVTGATGQSGSVLIEFYEVP